MSTKTSFKRIALVAVAALGLGVLSVAPSSAGQDLSNISIVSSDSTGSVGTPVSATVNFNFVATGDRIGIMGAAFYGAPATSSVTTGSSLLYSVPTDTSSAVNNNNTILDQQLSGSWGGFTYALQTIATALGRTSANYKLSFTPDKAGTYLVRIFGFPGGTTTAIFTDWTVVVSTPAPTAASSTGYESAIDSTTQGDFALATDNAGSASAPSTAGSLAGVVNVRQSNGSTTNPLLVGGKVTVTVSGAGLVSLVDLSGACSAVGAVRALTGSSTALSQKICMYSDGSSGVGTFAWSVGTTKLGSTTATFYGAPTSYTATINNPVIQIGAAVAASTTGMSNGNRRAVQVVVKDANGVAVPGQSVYMNSSDKTAISGTYQLATSDSLGRARFDLTGVAEGTSNLTFTNRATSSATTPATEITAGPLAVRVGSTDANAVKLAFDKSSYLPGERATITVTATDSTEKTVPRGIYSLFNSALSSSLPLTTGSTPGTSKSAASCADAYGVPTADAVGGACAAGSTQSSPALAAGQVWISGSTGTSTFTVNMPSISGAVTVSGTISTYLNGGLSANAGTAISATATVEVAAGIQAAIAAANAATAAAEAATDAATEAIDAANAATDSANAAAEAADAATAAAQQAGEDSVAAAEAAQAAAVDAAAEATEAANAATDAANAAAESADAATAAAQDASDAVAALSAQVTTLIAGLKAQLTALTNLLIKIQKKVKA